MQLTSLDNHSKLQLDYRTNITQNCQKIELYASLTAKELKKPHSSRWVGGVEIWSGLAPHPRVMDKNRDGHLGSQGSQCQEDTSPQLLAVKTVGVVLVGETLGFSGVSSWQHPCHPLHKDILRLVPCGPLHWGSTLKGTSGIQGGPEVSGIRAGARGQLFPDRTADSGHCACSEPFPTYSHSAAAPYKSPLT